MNLNQYQSDAMRTAGQQDELHLSTQIAGILNAALGAAGESGEMADIIKKVIFHGHPLDDAAIEKLDKEAGDVLWYLAQYATYRGTTLEQIGQKNIDKLTARYGQAFSTEASINRKPE